jgi:hypothetical protein
LTSTLSALARRKKIYISNFSGLGNRLEALVLAGMIQDHFGHAIFLDTHSWIRWWTKRDLGIIADSGSAVAHCPTPFARYGHIMENFGDYVRAGVTMGLRAQYHAPKLDERKYLNSEWVKVLNPSAAPVSLAGWWVRDSALRRYVFPPYRIWTKSKPEDALKNVYA